MSQARLTIDAELLMQELRHNQRHFAALLFWRDVREAGISLLLVPLWFYLGIKLTLPWTWYFVVPVLFWIAGFMLVDLMRHKRQPSDPDESLFQRAKSSLAEVERQSWLLRSVFWWYLLPIAVPITAFVVHVLWLKGSGDWLTVYVAAGMFTFEGVIFASVYWLNQNAVRSELDPRRQELQALLASLQDETPAGASRATKQ